MDWFKLSLFLCVAFVTILHVTCRKFVDLTHMYNINKTNSLHYPTFTHMKFKVVHRGWGTIGHVKAWIEYNQITTDEHVGTHIDAPSHFADGPGNWRLHQIPLENLIGEAVVIDISHKADVVNNPDALIEVNDVLMWEEKYGRIKDGSIVLMHSGWDKYVGDDIKYLGNDQSDANNLHYPGMGAEAAQWLVDNRKISGFGVDSMSLDAGSSLVFPAHLALLSANIYGLENLKNVRKLPPTGARLYVFPMKVFDGSGGPTRVVAEFDDMKPHHPTPGYNNSAIVSVSTALLIGLLLHMLM